MEAHEAGFSFDDFFIKESQIKKKEELEPKEFHLDISPKGTINKNKKTYRLEINFKVNSKNKSFKASVLAVGLFSFSATPEDEILNSYFYTNAPAIMFPYIRSYIAALTGVSGMETINLPLINFSEIGDFIKENTEIVE